MVLEGALRIYWGVLGVIHLKENDDQRTVVTIRKRNSCRSSVFNVKVIESFNTGPTTCWFYEERPHAHCMSQ